MGHFLSWLCWAGARRGEAPSSWSSGQRELSLGGLQCFPQDVLVKSEPDFNSLGVNQEQFLWCQWSCWDKWEGNMGCWCWKHSEHLLRTVLWWSCSGRLMDREQLCSKLILPRIPNHKLTKPWMWQTHSLSGTFQQAAGSQNCFLFSWGNKWLVHLEGLSRQHTEISPVPRLGKWQGWITGLSPHFTKSSCFDCNNLFLLQRQQPPAERVKHPALREIKELHWGQGLRKEGLGWEKKLKSS